MEPDGSDPKWLDILISIIIVLFIVSCFLCSIISAGGSK